MIGCLAQYLHLPQEPGHDLRFVLRHTRRNFEHARRIFIQGYARDA
jgi:hypothetical protein